MYEKDVDTGDVGAQWHIARSVFKPAPAKIVEPKIVESSVNRMVREGVSSFAGHEDVMKKILGENIGN